MRGYDARRAAPAPSALSLASDRGGNGKIIPISEASGRVAGAPGGPVLHNARSRRYPVPPHAPSSHPERRVLPKSVFPCHFGGGGGCTGVCGGKGLRLAEISPVGRSGFAEVFRFGRIGRERPGCGTGRRRRRETGLPIREIPAENPRAAGCSCGKVTHGIAKAFAESEFERYRVTRDRLCESDFDKTAQLALFGDRDAAEGLEEGEWRRVPSATLYANLTRPALRSLSGCFTMSRNGWNVPREPPR